MTLRNSAVRAGFFPTSVGGLARGFRSLLLLLLAAAAGPAAGAEGWLTSYDDALAAAEASGRPILVVFTGSDWCQHCLTLEKQVLETETFRDWADDRVICLMIDLPQEGISLDERKARSRICVKYGVRSFPTAVLAAPDGERIAAQAGYHGQTPETWVASFAGHLPAPGLAATSPAKATIASLDEAVATARDSRRPILVMVSRPGDAAASTRVASLLEDPEFESFARDNFVVARVSPADPDDPAAADSAMSIDGLLDGVTPAAEGVDIVVTDDGLTPLFTESSAESPQRVVSGLRRFLAARQASRGGNRR